MSDNSKYNIASQLLALGHEKVAEGNGHDALALVLDAIRMTQGEDAIMGILEQAKRKADYDIEQQRKTLELKTAKAVCQSLTEEGTILAERGEEDILVDAFKDGSSVMCRRCNSLIARSRAEQHSLYWCSGN